MTAAARLNTGARLPAVPLAGGVAVLGALKTQKRSQRCQTIRVRTAMMVNATRRNTVLLAPTAPTAAAADHLPAHDGIGTLQTAQRVGVHHGAIPVLLLTLAAKTWS